MIIKNGLVYQEDAGFLPQTVYIHQGLFADPKDFAPNCNPHASTETPPRSDREHQIIDATDCYIIPGLIDVHFHGCMGYDFCDATTEALDAMAAYQLQNGVTSICPASMTLPTDIITRICENASHWIQLHTPDTEQSSHLSRLTGINLEGPFISHEKKGAQNPDFIANASISLLEKWNQASGNLIKLITIAPETEGALAFIAKVKNSDILPGIHLSLGHTASDYNTAQGAFEAGADHVTHLFNAMPPFNHRDPGVIGAALDAPHCYVEIICDSIHISSTMIRAAFSMFTDNRIVLISDSMRATGLTDGSYTLGGQKVNVQGKYARLTDGTIAGSVTNLMDCLRTAVSMGIPLESAVKCATINPARSIGADDVTGSISPGKYGDCVILNQNLEIVHIIKGGNLISVTSQLR